MEAFSKFVSVIILVIFIFMVIPMYELERQDSISQSYVTSSTVDFVENVRKQGRITQDMYNNFIEILSSTGNTYDVEIVHTHTIVNPTKDEDGTITTKYYDDIVYTDEIMGILFGGLDDDYEQKYVAAGKVLGEYRMYKGDRISVVVKNRNITGATRMHNVIYHTKLPNVSIYATYGGEIVDENY